MPAEELPDDEEELAEGAGVAKVVPSANVGDPAATLLPPAALVVAADAAAGPLAVTPAPSAVTDKVSELVMVTYGRATPEETAIMSSAVLLQLACPSAMTLLSRS